MMSQDATLKRTECSSTRSFLVIVMITAQYRHQNCVSSSRSSFVCVMEEFLLLCVSFSHFMLFTSSQLLKIPLCTSTYTHI